MTSKRQARLARQRRFSDLDALLAEALNHQLNQRRGEGTVRRLAHITETLHQSFANPENWTERGVLMLLYVDERTGEHETIGVFQDLVHKTGARKLVRVEAADGANVPDDLPKETTTDHMLVTGYISPCPPSEPATPLEQRAIREYLSRTRECKLDEVLGSKHDAAKLLEQLKQMGVENFR